MYSVTLDTITRQCRRLPYRPWNTVHESYSALHEVQFVGSAKLGGQRENTDDMQLTVHASAYGTILYVVVLFHSILQSRHTIN